MSIATLARQKGTYLGKMTIRGSIIDFAPSMTRAKFIELGDLVYFMYVNDRLMKIGKTNAAAGFYDRAQTYKRGRIGDQTNNRIMDVMESIEETVIEIYGVLSPRESIALVCPLTGITETLFIKTAEAREKLLTQLYLNEEPARDLPFCMQLN
jgi:hypothetical protein